ncbi:filamentous hemagglutinin family N-terminal domain-containing protein [Dyella jiangningensis]|uniref:two-partner secretion domain-containing protein n=4 Tax=Gammaproteobacteria TaxID=1236 RepID=UPI00088F4CF7|nr:hemagglutinin repeat-containing protein [Dyella sp. AtDHG13]PXV58498.1 filamentous hemagglutinin [Dyella sp. AtDHG13]SDL18008.1 filamentous hemagglutinin family N-terminal domain-containing protein [Dyella jiangningensis]
MNKHLYRIVFNHALGLFQVVSELVRRPGRGVSKEAGVVAAAVRPVSLALWVSFGWIGLASVASAQIAGDMQAPGNQRPTVMAAPNNAPLINIQTPSAAGVSRNTYSRFDVGNEGAVLNNSHTNTQTQLAGTVSGNPWLANGTAKVILNEVTGPNPSQLNGYIEVAGDRAQVVIANPSGIACDGCGFINANRVTLTTGVPVLNGGALDGYRVTGGTIQINGKGMDASRADYADIIARAVQVNGGIWAPQLQVTTGANDVKADPSQASAITADGNKPTFALDVSALGGMYANKIALLGTEHGLGVRNAGNIGAQAGELTVTVDGRLENTGSLQSQTNTQINASGGIANAGTLSATRELDIATAQDVDNSGGALNAARIAVDAASMRNAGGTITQTSAQAIAMQVGTLSNRNGGRIGMPEVDAGSGSSGTPGSSTGNGGASTAGSSGSGSSAGSNSGGAGVTPVPPLADGALHITGLLDNDGGRITAASGFDLVTSNGVANDGGQLALRQLTLTGGDLSNRNGVLSVDKASTVHAAQVVNDGGQLNFAKALAFDAQALSNRAGSFLLADPAAMTFTVAGVLDNTGGTLASNASQFTLSSAALINEKGAINHAGADGFSLSTGSWLGAGGTVATAGAASISAGTVDHQDAVLSATQLTFRAVNLDNRGGTIASSGDQTNMLNVVGALDNGSGGVIRSNGDLFLTAETFGNAGGTVQHAGQGTLGIYAITLNGIGGTIASNGTLSLTGDTINVGKGTTYAQNVIVDAGSLTTAGGSLTALGAGALNVRTRNAFDNTGGTVATNGAMQIDAGSLDNTGGKLSAAGHDASRVQVADAFANNAGTIATSGATTLHAGTLANVGGVVQVAGGTLTVTADGLLDNSVKGTLTSDGDLSVNATTFDNTQGTIAHAGTGTLTIQATTLNGQGGTIASNGALSLTGRAINLASGTTYAQSIVLNADSLSTAGGTFTALGGTPLNLTVRGLFDNTHGTVATNGALQLKASSLTNADGSFAAAGKDATSIAVTQTFDNTRGTLAAMGATTIHGGTIVNQGGAIQASGGSTLTVTADDLLDNSAKGTLTSDGDLSVTAATLDNTQGTIAHAGTGALTIQAATLNGQGGTIAGNGSLSLTGGAINLANGITYAQSIALNADSLSTAGGNFTALGGTPLNLTVRGLFDNTRGTVATNGALQLQAQSLANTDGKLTAAGADATSIVVTNALDNTRGTLAAMGATTVHGGSIVNQGGTIQAGGGSTLTVTADGLLDNSQHGVLASDGDLSVTAATLDNTQGTIQHAGEGALTINASTLHGAGGTIASNGSFALHGGALDLSGGTTYAKAITLDADSLSTAGGNLTALGGTPLTLTVRGLFDNTHGTVATNGALEVSAQSLTNTDGTFSAAGTDATRFAVAQTFDNTRGTLAAMGATTVHGGTIINQGGVIQAGGGSTLNVTADDLLDNGAKGTLTSDGDLSVNATTLDNTQGTIAHAGTGALTIQAKTLNGQGGTIASNGALSLTGGAINLANGTTYAQSIVLEAESLSTAGGNLTALGASPLNLTVRGLFDNTRGTVATNGALQLNAGSVTNADGNLTAAGKDATSIAVAQTFDNTRGTLAAMGATTIHGGSIVNQGGTIQAGGGSTLSVTADDVLDNSAKGTLTSDGDLSVTAATLDNTQGTIAHAGTGALTIQAATLNGQGGTIASNGALSLTGGALNLTNGTTYAQSIALNADSLSTAGGNFTALGGTPLNLTVRGLFDNTRGTVATNGALQIDAKSLTNTGGTLTAAGTSATRITVAQGFDNTGGTLAAMGATTVHGGSVVNQGGTVQAGGGSTLNVTADGLLDNSQHGVLASDGDLSVTAATLDNTQGAIQHAGQGALTIRAATLNGQGGTLASNGALTIAGASTNLRGGTTTAQQISIDTGSLVTAGGNLSALGTGLLHLGVSGAMDNSGGHVATNGALQLNAGSLSNANGSILAAGANASSLLVTNAFDNTRGTLATTGTTTLHVGSLDNTGGTVQSASTGTLTVTTDGRLVNDSGTLVSNGALALTAGSVSNHAGAIQAQQGITATAAGTLDNSGGALIAGGDVNVSAGTLLNRDTIQGGPANSAIATQGIFGNRVQVQADTIDNTRGQIHANDALTLRGRSQGSAAITNAAGSLDGTGAVTVTASTLDNTGGQLIQRGDAGALSLTVNGALGNTAHGLIGAEGVANIQAGSFDNSGGTAYARHDFTLTSYGNLFNRSGGQLQTSGALALTANGSFDNSGGAVDATGAATVSAASVSNVGGQLLAGNAGNPNATLQVTSGSGIDNRGGSIGNRGGDTNVHASSIDNSSGGKLVAQRNVNLDSVGALNNIGGTVYATGDLSYQNGNAWLDNSGGQFGAGGTAWTTLSSITNANSGHIQAGTLWLNTTTLNLNGGEIDAGALHAQVSAINGVGRLYGSQLLDAHINGDYTYAAGQRFESDGVLSLTVGGTLTNQGALQTQGELDITAANLINQGSINASAGNGGASANINTSGLIDNQRGGRIEADTLTLTASDVTNTGNIVGDNVRINANTLTNGRDLGTAMAAVDYGEGFIGAANGMDLRIAQRLDNLDGDIFSGGNLNIAGRWDGTRVAALNNVSGRIQGQGNVSIDADQLDNRRRVINTATYVLSADEQAANSGSATVAQFLYSDSDPNHRPPAVGADQVVDAAGQAKAKAYCDSHNYSSLRCIGYPQGRGSPVVFQSVTTSTLTQVTVITSASADSRIESGGDMVLNGNIRNSASTIAATRNLTINGSGGGDGWASVQNIAWMPSGQVTTTTNYQTQSQYLINSPRTWLDGDWWTYDTSSGSQSVLLAPGNVPSWVTYDVGQGLSATITAGGNLSIGGNVTNTVVGAKGGGGAINAGDLTGPGGVALRSASSARAGNAGSVDNAHGSAVAGTGRVNGTQGQAVSGAGGVDDAQGQAVGDIGRVNGAQGQLITETSRVNASQGQGVGNAGSVARADGGKVGDAGGAKGVGAQSVGSSEQALPGYVPPSNAMYAQNGDPSAPFLVSTAPRFAKGASTSSDYLLKALGDDPSNTQKRLGDGYYEQQLVLDQLLQLTGRRTLNGGDPMAQYTALMNGAASEAERLGLSLGAPLTSSQISSLQSDIVWLVDQVVDGQHVLVPVVYLSKATAERLQNDGALLAGDTVNIQSGGTVRNDGTITGTQSTVINADTLINHGTLNGGQQLAIATRNDTINSGAIKGGTVSVQAGRDLVSTGAITSTGDMALAAGRDLTVGSAPVQSGGNLAMVAGHDLTASASHISAVGNAQLVAGNNLNLDATVHTTRTGGASNGQENTTHAVTDITAGGNLALVAGNDLTSVGAQLKAGNQLGLSAGHDITLNAVTDSQSNYSKTAAGSTVSATRSIDETVRGSTLSGANGVSIVAKNDLTATAATISSTNGGIGLMAGHDLTLNTAQENHSTVTDTKTTDSGLLSSTTKRTHDSVSDSLAMGTTISGDSVSMAAGHDLTATAAQIAADHDIVMAAGNNLTLNTANDVHTEEHGTSKTKSGLMGAGVGIMLGEAKQSQDATLTQTTPTGTTVGSLGGSVTMTAGNTVHLTDANVLSDTGTAIVGKNVTIDAAVGTTDTSQTYKQSSAGITLGLTGGAVTAAQAVYHAAKGASKSDDSRLKALYAAQGAEALFSPGAGNMMGLGGQTGAEAMGQAAQGNASSAGVSLRIGIGASSATATSSTHDETAYGSTIRSNGNVVIAATGGDLNVIGSKISGDNVALTAANNLNLLSQAEQHTDKSSNKNAGGEVGFSVGATTGWYASVSAGKGDGHGNGTTHATTTINATHGLSITSGGDTTIQGAQAKGETVLANIGGNLNIASEQDTDDFHSKQQQIGVTVATGSGMSGSYNQSNTDSHYASVTTVSGIAAGDGGFNIHVNGNTDLKGGVIASTADASRNLLDTGSLTFSNIENHAEYSASSFGVGTGGPMGMAGLAGLAMPQTGSASSTTKAGIADGTIITRNGNTDLSGLDRNPDINAQGLKQIFDQKKIAENQQIAALAGQVGMTAVGDISAYMANHATTEQEQKSWQDGGANKVILHGLVGAGTAALSGGNVAQAAAGAAASEAASKAMGDWLWDNYKISATSEEGKSLLGLASAAIGGVVGGGAGASTALQGEQFNRQLHPDYVQHLQSEAEKFAEQQCGCNLGALSPEDQKAATDNAMQTLLQTAQRMQDDTFDAKFNGAPIDATARAFIQNDNFGEYIGGTYYNLSQATKDERANPTINAYALYMRLNQDNNGGIEAIMPATGYSLSQYWGLAQADYNSGRPQGQNFDVQMESWMRQDSLDFLKFNGKIAAAGALGGFASLSPALNTLYMGYNTYEGADQVQQGNYVLGGLQAVGGLVGLGQAARELGQVSSLSEALWSPLGRASKATIVGSGEGQSNNVADEIDALQRIGQNPMGPLLEGKAPGSVLNTQYVRQLEAGTLPGLGTAGQPRVMQASLAPSATANDFAVQLLGREPTQAEYLAGSTRLNKGNCQGCWMATREDGTTIIYRPEGMATQTLGTTATVEINNPRFQSVNNGEKQLKLKFPQTGAADVGGRP